MNICFFVTACLTFIWLLHRATSQDHSTAGWDRWRPSGPEQAAQDRVFWTSPRMESPPSLWPAHASVHLFPERGFSIHSPQFTPSIPKASGPVLSTFFCHSTSLLGQQQLRLDMKLYAHLQRSSNKTAWKWHTGYFTVYFPLLWLWERSLK